MIWSKPHEEKPIEWTLEQKANYVGLTIKDLLNQLLIVREHDIINTYHLDFTLKSKK